MVHLSSSGYGASEHPAQLMQQAIQRQHSQNLLALCHLLAVEAFDADTVQQLLISAVWRDTSRCIEIQEQPAELQVLPITTDIPSVQFLMHLLHAII